MFFDSLTPWHTKAFSLPNAREIQAFAELDPLVLDLFVGSGMEGDLSGRLAIPARGIVELKELLTGNGNSDSNLRVVRSEAA